MLSKAMEINVEELFADEPTTFPTKITRWFSEKTRGEAVRTSKAAKPMITEPWSFLILLAGPTR